MSVNDSLLERGTNVSQAEENSTHGRVAGQSETTLEHGGVPKPADNPRSLQMFDILEVPPDAESILPRLGWSQKDVDEFQSMWFQVKSNFNQDLVSLGVDMLLWMVETIPGVKQLFLQYDKKHGSKRIIDSTFMNHGYKLIRVLDKMITNLGEPEKTLIMMRTVGRMHVELKIKIHYFELFRDNFHLFLYDTTTSKKGSRQAILWRQFLSEIIAAHKEEELKLRGPPEEPEKASCCSVM